MAARKRRLCCAEQRCYARKAALCGCGGIGRRTRFRFWRSKGRESSSLSIRTNCRRLRPPPRWPAFRPGPERLVLKDASHLSRYLNWTLALRNSQAHTESGTPAPGEAENRIPLGLTCATQNMQAQRKVFTLRNAQDFEGACINEDTSWCLGSGRACGADRMGHPRRRSISAQRRQSQRSEGRCRRIDRRKLDGRRPHIR